jgi:hypothetical protein
MASILSLIGWERFQHYRDRDPPWVKLYRDLLTSESWVLGTDTSRLVQVASVLLAARYGNKIPFDWKLIRKVASLDCTQSQFSEAVNHLAAYGFLSIQEVPSAQGGVEQSASGVLAKCSSETEAEERQSRAEKISVAQGRDDGPADRVFDHWRLEFKHPKAHLDPKRRKAIQRALESYDEATVCAAISGYRHSPHHMGQNDQRTVYDDISLFLRDSEHIERGLNFARAPPVPVKSAVELARERLRNGNGDGRVVSEQFGASERSLGQAVGLLRRVPDS